MSIEHEDNDLPPSYEEATGNRSLISPIHLSMNSQSQMSFIEINPTNNCGKWQKYIRFRFWIQYFFNTFSENEDVRRDTSFTSFAICIFVGFVIFVLGKTEYFKRISMKCRLKANYNLIFRVFSCYIALKSNLKW